MTRKAPTTGRRARWLRRLFDGLALALLAAMALWAGLFVAYAPELPDPGELWRGEYSPRITLLARDGSEIARRGGLRGRPIRPSELPPELIQAVLATEDRRFYSHFGIDVIGFGRAMLANLRAGRVVQGGSTITQQLAKNLYLNPERTIDRKLEEAVLAVWLEARLSKDQILALYLNRVYLGAGAYGVEAAAQRYFGKSARELELPEAAMIAGLLKAPSRYAPTSDLALARQRTAVVLDNMVEAGFLEPATAEAAKTRPARLVTQSDPSGLGYFIDWVLQELPERVSRVERDLVLHTTVDPAMQAAAQRALAGYLARRGGPDRIGQGAVVVLDSDGAVRALAGGRDYGESAFNRAVQARRQPGSAFKTFVYLAAFEQGLTPDTHMRDSPLLLGDWRPQNFGGGFRGEVTLREAFADSINTVAVKLSERVGRRPVIETAHRLGIDSALATTPALALGVSEVSLLELTGAYATIAAGGLSARPHGILEVRDADGPVLYRHRGGRERVIAARPQAQIDELLHVAVQEGTGRNAGSGAGKTGTSQDYRDAWFVGFRGGTTVGVWVGNDDNAAMARVTGGGAPALIWRQVMEGLGPRIAERPAAAREAAAAEDSLDGRFREAARRVADKAMNEAVGVFGDWLRRQIDGIGGDSEPAGDGGAARPTTRHSTTDRREDPQVGR